MQSVGLRNESRRHTAGRRSRRVDPPPHARRPCFFCVIRMVAAHMNGIKAARHGRDLSQVGQREEKFWQQNDSAAPRLSRVSRVGYSRRP